MSVSHGKVLKKVTTELPPCVLQRHEKSGLILVGTYNLVEGEKKTRNGSVEVYDSEYLNLLSTSYTEGSSILDLKILPHKDNSFVTAQSTGSIILWELIAVENRVVQTQEYQLYDTDVLILSVAFSHTDPNLLSATLSTGEVSIVSLSNDKGMEVCGTTQAHSELEAWTSSFGSGSLGNVIFSGGDDSALVAHDVRLFSDDSNTSSIWRRRLHEAGVTAILPSSEKWMANDPFCLWTGGYDDTLRSIDLRLTQDQPELQSYLIPRNKADINLGGGVWRLLPSYNNDNRVLVCCMYGGARIVNPTTDDFVNVDRSLTAGHDSMVYGGDWITSQDVVTCSFYDKQLQKWTTNI